MDTNLKLLLKKLSANWRQGTENREDKSGYERGVDFAFSAAANELDAVMNLPQQPDKMYTVTDDVGMMYAFDLKHLVALDMYDRRDLMTVGGVTMPRFIMNVHLHYGTTMLKNCDDEHRGHYSPSFHDAEKVRALMKEILEKKQESNRDLTI